MSARAVYLEALRRELRRRHVQRYGRTYLVHWASGMNGRYRCGARINRDVPLSGDCWGRTEEITCRKCARLARLWHMRLVHGWQVQWEASLLRKRRRKHER